jgi:hypothetical protein
MSSKIMLEKNEFATNSKKKIPIFGLSTSTVQFDAILGYFNSHFYPIFDPICLFRCAKFATLKCQHFFECAKN